MKEVLDYYKPKIDKSEILNKLGLISNPEPETSNAPRSPLSALRFFLVSVHREENVDNPENLEKIIVILNRLAETYNLPVIVSTHPRTRKRLEMPSAVSRQPSALIQFLKPFGFIDYIKLQMNAFCTLSDSGTISEESAMLSLPAISLRQSMERPEAQDSGTIILTGFDPDVVMNSVSLTIEEHKNGKYTNIPADYSITNTSWRVLKLIMGNTRLSNKWAGVESNR
jgi:UDP-N-acetylglucosamine 2-epimerase (non-hydrolysing)